ncbi:MAG: ATP-dependent DNA helicase RecG [Bacteroidetes bacterium]|nr:MAG: ATP-dependent DNA helicase RecG [Bacteroidota bacterium]
MHPIWNKDVMYLRKVGPVRADALRSDCRIATYGDLLQYFPRKYADRSRVSRIKDLREEGKPVNLIGKITSIHTSATRSGRSILNASFTDGSGFIELTWFEGVKWLQKSLKTGEEVALYGTPLLYNGRLQIAHPEIDRLESEDGVRNTLQIVPFYPSTEKLNRLGLDARGFRGLMHQLLEETRDQIEETLPLSLLKQYNLMGRKEALINIHFPRNFDTLKAALDRLKFEEFFFFQLMLALRRRLAKGQNRSMPFPVVGDYFNTFFKEHMPFELTGAQKRVLKEIRKDLAQPVQMNRLVQGDVGSGKTMVAFMSMLLAVDNGFQATIMTPTAILAEQHYKKISAMAAKVGLKTVLLVGSQRKKERTAILEMLASGEAAFAVGTHALIEDPVVFKRLGLVVVDEQHKFGVMQRARLWQKANPLPHNMSMTATPIPRTLAMTVYGDVDVSVIDELPPGRKPIQTVVAGEAKRLEVFGMIRRELEMGRQAYVVYPLVEESEKSDLLAAEQGHEVLQKAFQGFRTGLVHGRMKPENKEIEMQQFIRRETHILVSTTVIEVGVDVPNASVMMIENAERFGLSQLHQLRGRVGRGADQSYCVLMAGAKLSLDGKKRLSAMRETQDGFRIAEIDLELRGPGDFLGTRQSGLPEFQLGNIVEDQPVLRLAREAAFLLSERDPELQEADHQALRQSYIAYLQKQGASSTLA